MPLDALIREVWAWRWRVLLLAVLLYAVGAALIVTWPRRYLAQAMVTPAETTGIAASALLSHPLNMAGSAVAENRFAGNFAVYLDALRAPEAAAMLARETPLLAHLTTLRGEGAIGAVRRTFDLRLEADVDDAVTWLQRSLAVTPALATLTLTVSVAHRDRAAALDILQRLHAHAEAKVRADIAAMTARRIAAIEQRLAAERDLFLRNGLFELLGQQQRAGLVVAADEAVAARFVSAPSVGVRPSLPNLSLLLAMLLVTAPAAVAGGALCVALLRAGAAMPRYGVESSLPSWRGAEAD